MSTSSSRRHQVTRLIQIILALRSGFPNAETLASLCEVSRRTIYRDLDSLLVAGVPVRFRAERQGYELAPEFQFGCPRLTEREAAAALVSLRTGKAGFLGLSGDILRVESKLLGGLAPEELERLARLGLALGPAHVVGTLPQDPWGIIEAILSETPMSLLAQERLIAPPLAKGLRVEPLRLRLTDLVPELLVGWSAQGRPHYRAQSLLGRQRNFEEPGPRSAPAGGGRDGVVGEESRDRDSVVHLRCWGESVEAVRGLLWPETDRWLSRHADTSEFLLRRSDPESLVPFILSWAGQVQVLAPPGLRRRIRRVCLQIARGHGSMVETRGLTPR